MNLIPAGYFSKPHGLKGHLVFFTDAEIDENVNAVFIENNGSQAPYFIEEISLSSKGYILKLEGVNTADEALKLKNKTILVDDQFIISESETEFEFAGYKLIDVVKGLVGIIVSLEGNDENPLLLIRCGDKEILLPFQDELIKKVNKSKKELHYNAPEGLIDMYLEL